MLFSYSYQKQKGKQLIELNEKNVLIQKQESRIKILEDELNNCKLNYKALDDATK